MIALDCEQDVKQWLTTALDVSRETLHQLDAYVTLLREANRHQNLISASTAGEVMWKRHIADSAQLALHAPEGNGRWLDLGSGPGLPGLVIAILQPARPMILLESRKLRCAFLRDCCSTLGLGNVEVVEKALGRYTAPAFPVISARAFAPLPRLLTDAAHVANDQTTWLLPKGKNGVKELSTLSRSWQSRFHVEHSLTDPEAVVLIGNGTRDGSPAGLTVHAGHTAEAQQH